MWSSRQRLTTSPRHFFGLHSRFAIGSTVEDSVLVPDSRGMWANCCAAVFVDDLRESCCSRCAAMLAFALWPAVSFRPAAWPPAVGGTVAGISLGALNVVPGRVSWSAVLVAAARIVGTGFST